MRLSDWPIWCVVLLVVLILIVVSANHEPRVVVNMPADARPLSQLTPVPAPTDHVITNERAVLWWTIYHETFKSERHDDAMAAADEAVDKVYGSAR